MQDEGTWMSRQSSEESAAKERYEFFTRPEPRDNMSDIYYVEDDEFMGRAKCRDLRIGMTRNAKEENKKVVRAYLEPFPHLRIDNAKPLQGWYQSLKNESAQSRPRPCLLAGSKVDTPSGTVPIESLRKGDVVLGRNMDTGETTESIVEGTATKISESYLELELESGEILKITPEHLVYTNNRGWVEAGNLTLEDDLCDLLVESTL